MPTGIIITAIICVTLIVLVAMSRSKAQKGVYEYKVVHIENPRNAHDAIEKGIAAATHVFPGEVVAVCNDPFYEGMKAPTYSVVIKTPIRGKRDEQ